jgi:hypothetical protein
MLLASPRPGGQGAQGKSAGVVRAQPRRATAHGFVLAPARGAEPQHLLGSGIVTVGHDAESGMGRNAPRARSHRLFVR